MARLKKIIFVSVKLCIRKNKGQNHLKLVQLFKEPVKHEETKPKPPLLIIIASPTPFLVWIYIN
jgi:hypothetical protein